MSHVRLLPYCMHRFGGFKFRAARQGALKMIDNAKAIRETDAIGVEMEATPWISLDIQHCIGSTKKGVRPRVVSNCREFTETTD